ncbi:MAG: cytochrome c-type biogenesis protein CcmH [Comamonas sp.]|nr:cytochrome c-type biogenesis protein CcmH [Comamonas sp.]
MRNLVLVLCTALACFSVAAAGSLEEREAALAQQLRCVVCQNQTVAESQAPIAKDMRAEIVSQLSQGRSDEEVVAFFEQRYGTFVRYTPPWKPSTWLLWCTPFIALIGGFVVLWRTLRNRKHVVRNTLTPQERLRAKAWLEQKTATGSGEERR